MAPRYLLAGMGSLVGGAILFGQFRLVRRYIEVPFCTIIVFVSEISPGMGCTEHPFYVDINYEKFVTNMPRCIWFLYILSFLPYTKKTLKKLTLWLYFSFVSTPFLKLHPILTILLFLFSYCCEDRIFKAQFQQTKSGTRKLQSNTMFDNLEVFAPFKLDFVFLCMYLHGVIKTKRKVLKRGLQNRFHLKINIPYLHYETLTLFHYPQF